MRTENGVSLPRGSRFVRIRLLGTDVWPTDMPGFFADADPGESVVVQPNPRLREFPLEWIDDRLIPDEEEVA